MWPDVPWQIDVLIAETLFSMAMVAVVVTRGMTTKPFTGILSILCNIAILALLLTGGSPTWQHYTYAALTVWATMSSIRNLIIRKTTPPSENPVAELVFATALSAGVIYLLIGGVA